MHIITRQKLLACWMEPPDVEDALKAWEKEAEHAHWKSPVDIKARYRSADILLGNRVVFNIKGKHYRLVVKIHYNTEIVYIRFVGTHEEYNRINAEII
ncbi:type II toxin-antitoxin system HigB family toxin [bacterium]|nr:type II toxin-antitoxin system HigB family toxin [bacterium]OIO90257.1 MAG: addiction module toxin RelE [Anaerolineae bacterium CG2_30_58_95]PIU90867.1 MAG: addiction module toxin RelE [Anaerolineae bacterium CG06_land_8_20_14_3_00_57_67]PIW19247.1 MAG: addiction module toxin RelE [Anaerolineae bacterium CG17_big_fil_post_rev_8_21_14_2_50_57_27]PIZ26261.1 MAG: addiction module toxin RelE [Chloroflexi bacterium CG_4_10_14_0_8_um_filter_57_5]